jgi:hypothetical protein
MEDKNIQKDSFIRQMMHKKGTEKPSHGFTERVMQQVEPIDEVVKDRLLSPVHWISIGFAVVAAIVTIVVFDVSFFQGLFSFELSELSFSMNGDQLIRYFNALFEGWQMSTVSIMAFSAIFILLGLERLFRYTMNRNRVYIF